MGEIREIRGNIFECINEAIAYVQNHISYKAEIIGIQREEIPEIPLKAIREIVINAFAHCSYAKVGDYIQISVYKSYIKIYSPGPIIRNIDPKKFASGEIGSKIRNPLIASVLFKNGYIESFGTGFDRTFALCERGNVEYNYQNDDFGFTFIFQRKVDLYNDKINDKINDLDKKIIELIRMNKYITRSELAKKDREITANDI